MCEYSHICIDLRLSDLHELTYFQFLLNSTFKFMWNTVLTFRKCINCVS